MRSYVTFETRCGCSRTIEWEGRPPLLLRVPLSPKMSFDDWAHRPLEAPAPEVRTFEFFDNVQGPLLYHYKYVEAK